MPSLKPNRAKSLNAAASLVLASWRSPSIEAKLGRARYVGVPISICILSDREQVTLFICARGMHQGDGPPSGPEAHLSARRQISGSHAASCGLRRSLPACSRPSASWIAMSMIMSSCPPT